MIFSPYSCLMAILWFTLFIVLANFLQTKTGLLIHYNFSVLILIIIVSVLRVVLPFELPITNIIRSMHIYPAIQDVLGSFHLTYHAISLQAVHMLLFIWVMGTFTKFGLFLLEIADNHKIISAYRMTEDAQAATILEKLVSNTRPGAKYRLVVSPDVQSPLIVGLIKPTILMPVTAPNDEHLKYYILHEWQHFLNRDHWIKLIVIIIDCFMWWNIPVMVFRKRLDDALEIRCDLNACKNMSNKEKHGYLSAMNKIVSSIEEPNFTVNFGRQCSWMIGANTTVKLYQLRVKAVANHSKPYNVMAVFCLTVITLYFLSYCVLFQPYHDLPTEANPNAVVLDIEEESSYLILHNDGTYSFIYEGEPVASVTSEQIKEPPFNSLQIILENDGGN